MYILEQRYSSNFLCNATKFAWERNGSGDGGVYFYEFLQLLSLTNWCTFSTYISTKCRGLSKIKWKIRPPDIFPLNILWLPLHCGYAIRFRRHGKRQIQHDEDVCYAEETKWHISNTMSSITSYYAEPKLSIIQPSNSTHLRWSMPMENAQKFF